MLGAAPVAAESWSQSPTLQVFPGRAGGMAESARSNREVRRSGYVDTNSIAQKSLARCAPLIGELSELTREPVMYWYGM